MMRSIVTTLLLLLTVFGGAVTQAAPAGALGSVATLEEHEELQHAQSLLKAGKNDESLMLLRGFVVRFPSSPLMDDVNLALSRIFYRRGQLQESRLYFNRLGPGAKRPEAQLLEGLLLIDSGQLDAGTRRLRDLPAQDLDSQDRQLRLQSLARAYAELHRPLEALTVLNQLHQEAPEGDGIALEKAHRQVQQLDEPTLAEAAFMFRGTAIGQDAGLEQARRDLAAGRNETALARIQAVVIDPTPFPYRGEAVALLDRLTGKPWLQRSVGVLLPLSGRYAAFGELVQRGMTLAAELHNRSRRPVPFLFRDVGGGPEVAVEQVAKLANEDRVMALVGPITGNVAATAATAAQREQIPLLTLSQRPGLPQQGDYIFRDTLTSRLQAKNLARYAVQELGLTSFGVLAPENRLGRDMSQMFAEEVLALGGLVIGEEYYAEDATDFRRQIRLLMDRDPDGPDDPVLTPEQQLADLFDPDFPAVDFEALFIPDYADKIALIAPQLPFYGISDVQLLGINGWNTPDLTRNAGAYVEGAVFVDGFFRNSPYPFVKEFVDLYFEKYAEEPSILEAQGFDVANIILSLLDRPEIVSRDGLRLALSMLRDYPGVTGATSFDAQGEAQKVLFILQVQNGNIVQLN